MVRGDADDVESIKAAVQGASIVFGNTIFSTVTFDPEGHKKVDLKPGKTTREWAYETELRHGKNIADAVASVADGLDLFVWSSLSNAMKWSKGKYTGVLHFNSKAHVVDYINEQYPQLAKKMSIIQMGLFVTNWMWGQASVNWSKVRSVTEFTGSCEELFLTTILRKMTGQWFFDFPATVTFQFP